MESKQGKQGKQSDKFFDPRQIHKLYRLSHPELDTTLKRLRDKVLEELEDFSTKLIGSLNHLNFFRYMRAFPNDNIQFVFQEKVNASVNQTRLQEKQNILARMGNFETLKIDYAGVSDNCIYEIEEFITENEQILNMKNICPSGTTFLNQNNQMVNALLPYWDKNQTPMDLTGVFKEASEHFPKQQLKKLGSIFSETNKKVISAQMIFRASSHNFQSAIFKEQCENMAPTLMLAKSDKGLIFGGFTPCKWLKTKQKQYVSDPKGQSFLFSLSKNLVFPIKMNQKDYAISAYGGWGPIYGSPYGPDLSISDKCHLNDHSCSSLGSHYEVPSNIKEYSTEAFCLLAGAKKFKVIQYQLYKLVLDEQQ